jgi:putative flippase GtrA
MTLADQLRAYSDKDYVRFLLSGAFNTALSFLLYSAGILLGLHYALANAIAWAMGVAVSFSLNSRFVFRKGYTHKRFLSFVASNLFCLVLSMAILSVLIKFYAIDAILASIVTIPIVVGVNFFGVKRIVFK